MYKRGGCDNSLRPAHAPWRRRPGRQLEATARHASTCAPLHLRTLQQARRPSVRRCRQAGWLACVAAGAQIRAPPPSPPPVGRVWQQLPDARSPAHGRRVARGGLLVGRGVALGRGRVAGRGAVRRVGAVGLLGRRVRACGRAQRAARRRRHGRGLAGPLATGGASQRVAEASHSGRRGLGAGGARGAAAGAHRGTAAGRRTGAGRRSGGAARRRGRRQWASSACLGPAQRRVCDLCVGGGGCAMCVWGGGAAWPGVQEGAQQQQAGPPAGPAGAGREGAGRRSPSAPPHARARWLRQSPGRPPTIMGGGIAPPLSRWSSSTLC
jgi:hypothetical protein